MIQTGFLKWYLLRKRPPGTILAGFIHCHALLIAAIAVVGLFLAATFVHPLTPGDFHFFGRLARNPFLWLAALLLGLHIVNFDYLAYAANRRRPETEPLLYPEKTGDWKLIESTYLGTYGKTLFYAFHKFALKAAFVIMAIGLLLI